MYCKYCELDVIAIIQERPDTPHEAQYVCPYCTRHLGWKSKEKNLNKRHSSNIKIKIDYCQMCLREKSRLGQNETLHQHHIIEIQNTGVDEQENIWTVCTCCHNIIHFFRTYLNCHFKELWRALADNDKNTESSKGISQS